MFFLPNIFDINQFINNNNQRNLNVEKNIIELELFSDSEGEVKFINGYTSNITNIYVDNEEMTVYKLIILFTLLNK